MEREIINRVIKASNHKEQLVNGSTMIKISQVNQLKLDEIVKKMDKRLTKSIKELERQQATGISSEARRASARRFRQ